MQEELMRLRHENQVLRAENEALKEVAEMMDFLEAAGIDNCEAYEIGMRKFHESKKEPVDVEVVDEDTGSTKSSDKVVEYTMDKGKLVGVREVFSDVDDKGRLKLSKDKSDE